MVRTLAKDILKNLRDGDWKERPASETIGTGHENLMKSADSCNEELNQVNSTSAEEDIDEDLRIEGTTAYLPPEVVLGAFPTYSSDSWALGCVTYQCLTGRPPLLEASEQATKNRIVSFDNDSLHENSTKCEIDALFQEKHASGIPPEARDMIKSLLDRIPSNRPSMHRLAEFDFFKADVFTLHSLPAYPLDVGNVSPEPSSQWARRQYSSIWAPQPKDYDISLPDNELIGQSGNDRYLVADSPIAESDERIGFFTSSGTFSHSETLMNISSRVMPIPPS